MRARRRELAAQQALLRMLDHEVRSPLTVARGWAEVLLDDIRAGDPVDGTVVVQLHRAVEEVSALSVRVLDELAARNARGTVVDGRMLARVVQRVRAEVRGAMMPWH